MAMGQGHEDERIGRCRDICMACPEAEMEHVQHFRFLVRGKPFAYFVINHHGDGRIAVEWRMAVEERDALLADDLVRFFMPSYVGRYGWMGLDLDAAPVNWDEVAAYVHESYRILAPKALARALDSNIASASC